MERTTKQKMMINQPLMCLRRIKLNFLQFKKPAQQTEICFKNAQEKKIKIFLSMNRKAGAVRSTAPPPPFQTTAYLRLREKRP